MSKFQKFLDDNLKKINLNDFEKDELLTENDNLYQQLSNMILKLRIETGLTQVQLAKLSGLTQSNISNMESGHKHPTIESLKRIADATGKKLIIEFKDEEVG